MKKKLARKEEVILNVPNIITLFRIPLAIIASMMLFSEFPKFQVMIVFALCALTDFIDGQIARRFNLVTRFGAKFDQYADRLATVIFMISLIVYYWNNSFSLMILLMLSSREIIGSFGIAIRFFRDAKYYAVKNIGKLQTLIQFVTICLFLINVSWIIYPAIFVCIIGIIAGLDYLIDSLK
jgi:CDP-diacylglycerol--glycerol-3-phosphate 3-phosphatidyltransferase